MSIPAASNLKLDTGKEIMNRREAKVSGVRGRKEAIDFCQ